MKAVFVFLCVSVAIAAGSLTHTKTPFPSCDRWCGVKAAVERHIDASQLDCTQCCKGLNHGFTKGDCDGMVPWRYCKCYTSNKAKLWRAASGRQPGPGHY